MKKLGKRSTISAYDDVMGGCNCGVLCGATCSCTCKKGTLNATNRLKKGVTITPAETFREPGEVIVI